MAYKFTMIGACVAAIGSVAALVIAEASSMTGSQYAEWTALGVVCFVVVWLITKTLPAVNSQQQNTITSLVAQTDALRTTLAELANVVSQLGERQTDVARVVEANQRIQELQIKQLDTLQIIVVEIMRTLTDARDMMKPVPALREEENRLLREMLATMKKG